MPDEKKQAGRNLQEPIGIVKYVTKHALERWMERIRISSWPKALASLKKHLARATEVELTPEFQAIALLNHDLKPARYLKFDTWIFVVSEDGGLVTIHSGASAKHSGD